MKKNIYIYCRGFLLSVLATVVATGLSPVDAMAQGNGMLNGKVVDEYGNPVAGVTINISGVAEDVTTDVDGAFKVVNDPNVVVSLYHENYLNQEFKLGKVKHPEKPLVVVLSEKEYKKTDIINGPYQEYDKDSFLGAETSISGEQIAKTMSSTIIPGMMGRAAGLNIYQYRGARLRQATANTGSSLLGSVPVFGSGAYSDNSEFSIGSRGQAPVVIIDGVERDIYSIDPEAIETVSIQKDALSSMFLGMRSSRGAMVITSKKPKQEGFQLSFTGRWGITSTIKKPKPLSSYQYAYLLNEALSNDGKSLFYTAEDFQKFRDGSSPYTHPDVNWFDEMLDDNGFMQSYNVNVSGGNKFAQYYVNFGYFGEDGIFKQTDLDNYNTKLELERYMIDSKVNINITD
ncbi:MAG: TonB-dependent receptor plug domain-containing protein, partial [Muribaculaceae bacterium]|nr:TonB-dependent receptor plug domain-containing protein [Muribaculaceae bacterium]